MSRELDCEIAVKIFNWRREELVCGDGDFFIKGTKVVRWYKPNDDIPILCQLNDAEIKDLLSNRLPHYSTNMNDAWILVDWLIKEKNFHFHLNWIPDDNEWIAGGGWISGGETPQLAICNIALKVAKSEEEKNYT